MHGNEFGLFVGQGIPPILTICVAHLTYQHYEPFLTSLVMTQCWSQILTTFPTTSECAPCWATIVGYLDGLVEAYIKSWLGGLNFHCPDFLLLILIFRRFNLVYFNQGLSLIVLSLNIPELNIQTDIPHLQKIFYVIWKY